MRIFKEIKLTAEDLEELFDGITGEDLEETFDPLLTEIYRLIKKHPKLNIEGSEDEDKFSDGYLMCEERVRNKVLSTIKKLLLANQR
jgi:hypothetical protein